MTMGHLVACFFGGAFLMNAIPHAVAGAMGRALQTPFANSPGQGLSSSTVNVLWGFFNLAVAWGLLARVGGFDVRVWGDALAAALGACAISLHLARHFGRFNGGNTPP